jgi:RHS repeat-associated protein
MSQSFQYDWLGNTTNTDDDAHGFYDRSIGTVTNGTATQGPYRLLAAQGVAGSPQGGGLTATYDAAGNLTSLAVVRRGTCLPSGASCSQRFAYEWDEVGRLVDARRWDGESGNASAELRYAYDATDQRTLKTAVGGAPGGSDAQTVYVFGSLELRRTTWDPTAQDYVRSNSTDVGYLSAHGVRLARLHYAIDSVPPASSGQLHVLMELPDHLGSTRIAIDHDTGELVEASSYLSTGGADADYRPVRWSRFREDYRFTGKEEDIEVGLTYFGRRFYAPNLGRWISPDPLAIHGIAADLNVYAYVIGSLLKQVDPVGLDTDTAFTAEQALDTDRVRNAVENVIGTLGPAGAPTRLLQEVKTLRFDLYDRDSLIDKVLNYGLGTHTSRGLFGGAHITLQQQQAAGLEKVGRTFSLGETDAAIATIFHEGTHAYIIDHASNPALANVLRAATDYYKGAVMSNGRVVSDPARLAEEAAAEYVEHRIQSWFSAYTQLQSDKAAGRLDQAEAQNIARQYDKAMSQRVFGYDNSSNLSREVTTSKPIPDTLKQFLDGTLLEGRISDRFEDDPKFKELTKDVNAAPSAAPVPNADH